VKGIRDRRRSVKKRVLQVVKLASYRTRHKYEEVKEITSKIASIASKVVKDARKVLMRDSLLTKIVGKFILGYRY